MRIEVRFRALDASEPLREHVLRAVHFHLSRFGRELSSVSARIGDVNGPRGGIDKRCQLHVRGPRIGSLVVAEVSADACAAVDVCAERAGRSVGRELERLRTRGDSSPAAGRIGRRGAVHLTDTTAERSRRYRERGAI